MSTAVSTPLPDLSLYDKDFHAWLFQTAALLRQGRVAELTRYMLRRSWKTWGNASAGPWKATSET